MNDARNTNLDHASGQPLHPAAREFLERALDQGYGDPRRLHQPAREARLVLDNARAVVAECLGVSAEQAASPLPPLLPRPVVELA